MQLNGEQRFKLPIWWFIYPTLLAIWSTVFGAWPLFDGDAAFAAFGLDVSADTFIYQLYGARYLSIAFALWLGLWIFRTPAAILTAWLARIVTDAIDLIAGLSSGAISGAGAFQSVIMFLGPELILLGLFYYYKGR